MSGKNQHYIPRAVLESFSLPSAKTPQVHVYRREKSFPSAITNVAAEDYFYSRPADDGSETLDDVLTRHENGPLSQDLRTLAAIDSGPVEGLVAARVVAHLTGRGNHVRGLFRAGGIALADLVEDLFGTQEAIANALGADGPSPGPRFQSIMAEQFANDPQLADLGLPLPFLTSLGYSLLRENAKRGFEEMTGLTRQMAETFRTESDRMAREVQGKSLAAAPVADSWATALAAFDWRIEAVSEPGYILPDFVGLATGRDGADGTIFGIGGDDLGSVLVPLSPTKMLIGDAGDQCHDLSGFNARAAPHCLAFFVSGYASETLEALREEIGTRVDIPVREGLRSAAAEFRGGLDLPSGPLPADAGGWRETPWSGFSVHSDYLAGEELERCGQMLGAIAGHMRNRFDIDRLLRVMANADYAAAVAANAPNGSSIAITPSETGWSAAYNIDMEEDGEHRVLMILHPDSVAMVMAEDDLLFGAGVSIILAQLIKIGTDALLWEVFSDRQTPGNGPDRLLLPYVIPAWSSYHIALEQSRFEPRLPSFYRDRFVATLEALPARLVAARRGYWLSGVVDDLISTAISPVAQLMAEAASAIAAIEVDDGANLTAFFDALEAAALLSWFELFADDLRAIWQPGTAYPDPQAFQRLARHAERLLFTGGLLVWDDDSPFGRIDVPHGSDPEWR